MTISKAFLTNLLLLLFDLIAVGAFQVLWLGNERQLFSSSHVSSSCLFSGTHIANNYERAESSLDYHYDDDDDLVIPYMNRTLGWTKRYRMLVPYSSARRTAMRLGLRSKEEWEDIREFGKAFHGAHSVSRPDLMYSKEWISWEEFLGVMRPYEEAKEITQNQLNITSMEEYRDWVSNNTKEAEDLRIPAKPDIVYRNKGWESPEAFFGQQ